MNFLRSFPTSDLPGLLKKDHFVPSWAKLCTNTISLHILPSFELFVLLVLLGAGTEAPQYWPQGILLSPTSGIQYFASTALFPIYFEAQKVLLEVNCQDVQFCAKQFWYWLLSTHWDGDKYFGLEGTSIFFLGDPLLGCNHQLTIWLFPHSFLSKHLCNCDHEEMLSEETVLSKRDQWSGKGATCVPKS